MSEILKRLKAWNSFANGGPRPEDPPVRCEEAADEIEQMEQRIRELQTTIHDLRAAGKPSALGAYFGREPV